MKTKTWTVLGITVEHHGHVAIAAYEGILRPADLYRTREFMLGIADEGGLGVETWVRRVQSTDNEAAMNRAIRAQWGREIDENETECVDSRYCGHSVGSSGHCFEMVCRNYTMKCGHRYGDPREGELPLAGDPYPQV